MSALVSLQKRKFGAKLDFVLLEAWRSSKNVAVSCGVGVWAEQLLYLIQFMQQASEHNQCPKLS